MLIALVIKQELPLWYGCRPTNSFMLFRCWFADINKVKLHGARLVPWLVTFVFILLRPTQPGCPSVSRHTVYCCDDLSHRWRRNGEFRVTVGPVTCCECWHWLKVQKLDLSLGLNEGHRPRFSSSVQCCHLHLFPVLYLCPAVHISTSRSISSRCSSLVFLFLCGHVACTGALAWQCCCRTSLECAQAQWPDFFDVLAQMYIAQCSKVAVSHSRGSHVSSSLVARAQFCFQLLLKKYPGWWYVAKSGSSVSRPSPLSPIHV